MNPYILKKDNYLFPSSGPIIINLYDWIGSKRIKMFSDMYKSSQQLFCTRQRARCNCSMSVQKPRMVEHLTAKNECRMNETSILGVSPIIEGQSSIGRRPDYLPMSTSMALMSLGETPGMRLACASVSGSIRCSFCRASIEICVMLG